MASQWRIRHKLMLGLVLVVGTVALVIGATSRGLWSYHTTIGEIRERLKELESAEAFKESVTDLLRPIPEGELKHDGAGSVPGKQEQNREPGLAKADVTFNDPITENIFLERIKACKTKLGEYESVLGETAGRAGDSQYVSDHRELIRKLREEFTGLSQARAELPEVIDQRFYWKETRPVRLHVAALERTANDLRSNIHEVLNSYGNKSRSVYQMALWIIIPASVIGLLSIIGLMRVFRWVFAPIRDLQAGVNRVAQGDFDHPIVLHSGDEMEDLAAAFNDMTRRLSDLYADLARQVNERSRQLVRSERLASVGFLAAGVAHEINNPLASIAFCSEALEARLADLLRQPRSVSRRTDDEEVFAKYLRMIQEEAFRCKKITEKLLEFSRTGERRREPTDLAGLVQSVIDITQHLQNCKGKQIVFEPATGLPYRDSQPIAAPINAEEIKSVVLNLVVNALDSMEEGGKLSIRLGLHDDMAEMYFTDTGCGMTPDVLENIFEPFFTRSRSGKGTGLGLTISHRIINQHGGEIEANSEGPGKGSTFVVRLPLKESEPRQTVPSQAERARRAA